MITEEAVYAAFLAQLTDLQTAILAAIQEGKYVSPEYNYVIMELDTLLASFNLRYSNDGNRLINILWNKVIEARYARRAVHIPRFKVRSSK